MKSSPERRCAGCGAIRGKSELIRIVRLPESHGHEIVFDPKIKYQGRSLYFCPMEKCFEKVMRRKAPEKLMKISLPAHVRDEVIDFLSNAESAQ